MFRRFVHGLLVLGLRAGLIVLACAVYLCYWQFRKGGLLDFPMPVAAQYAEIPRPCAGNYRVWTHVNDRAFDSIYQDVDDSGCHEITFYGRGSGHNTYYVASTASNWATTCTASEPCSMSSVFTGNTLVAGDTVQIAPGVYDTAERR